MKTTNLILMLAAFCFFFMKANAQNTSYLFIQGDKEKPFYVKVDGVMSNRYGKNYCIFPKLKAGTSKMEILYEQSTLPAQEYSIVIPNNAFRAFLLTKKDGNYALYDIHQQFYLKPSDADHYFANQTMTQAPVVIDEQKKEEPKPVVKNEVVKVEASKKEEAKKEEQQFINNVVINEADEPSDYNKINTPKEEKKEEPKPSNPVTTQPQSTTKEIKLESNATPIYNSNCPTAMRDKDYEDLLKNAKAVGKGDKLVKFLLAKIPNNCYTTKQVYQLADLLDEEAIIYLYLKRVYPQVSDQQNFHLLESYLFESEEWTKAFRLIH
jgi:hypothetical protein